MFWCMLLAKFDQVLHRSAVCPAAESNVLVHAVRKVGPGFTLYSRLAEKPLQCLCAD